MFADHEDSAAEMTPPRQAIDPGHAVAGRAMVTEQLQQPIQRRRTDDGLLDKFRLDGAQSNPRRENNPGKPHSAERCLEKLAVFRSRADQHRSVGESQAQALDMLSERPISMMVL